MINIFLPNSKEDGIKPETVQIATLVERTTRFCTLVHLRNKRANDVASALIGTLLALPPNLGKSLTWDQVRELSHHQHITRATGTKIYFCEPLTVRLDGRRCT